MSGQKVTGFGVCSDFEARANAWLRGRHPGKTAECVAADIGISVNTVRKWLSRESRPNAVAVFRLIAAYGPEFLAAVYPKAPAWLSSIVRAERLASLDAEIADLQAAREVLR
jgi:hypothetical protein